MAATVVPDRGSDGIGNGIEVGDQLVDRLTLELGMILECVVEVCDISLVMFRMMDLHRFGVDVGLERAVVVRQRRQGVVGHGVVLRRVEVRGKNTQSTPSHGQRECHPPVGRRHRWWQMRPWIGSVTHPDGISRMQIPERRARIARQATTPQAGASRRAGAAERR